MAASPPEYAVRAPEEATTRWQGRTTHKGFGYRNFDNYRLRLLLYSGVTWHNQQPRRIRTRRPRMVASRFALC